MKNRQNGTNEEWKKEFEKLREKNKLLRKSESIDKEQIKALERELKEWKSRRYLHTKERRSLDKLIRTFWQKKNAEISYRRSRVKEKPALAFEAIERK